jgi:hypothetical protein
MPFAHDRPSSVRRSQHVRPAHLGIDHGGAVKDRNSDYIRGFNDENRGEGQKVDGDQSDSNIEPHRESPREKNVCGPQETSGSFCFDNAGYHSSGYFADSVFDADRAIHNFHSSARGREQALNSLNVQNSNKLQSRDMPIAPPGQGAVLTPNARGRERGKPARVGSHDFSGRVSTSGYPARSYGRGAGRQGNEA